MFAGKKGLILQPIDEEEEASDGRITVLVIDDEPDVLTMLELGLTGMGYQVEVADSGHEAIRRLHERHFDLALADLRMPGLDGIATTQRLKAIDPDIDVLIATAYVSDETRDACLQSGASDFISKPFTLNALQAFLDRVVARRRARRDDGHG